MAILIKNGLIVNASGTENADVLIEGGMVAAVGGNLSAAAGTEVIDASGKYVFPGFIDTHTHFDLSLGWTSTADDFITGSRAAILGGTTAVLDFATQERGDSLKNALALWHEKARGSSCNYGFHMALAGWDEKTQSEMDLMSEEGVTSYKMYMVYDGLKVDDGEIYAALKAAKAHGALIGIHCENWEVLRCMIAEVKAAGMTGPQGHPLSRPAAVEAEAVARLMRIAQLADAPAYVVHLSTEQGLMEARRARERGQEVYLETCPQYLLLDDARYADADGAKFVMSPPLRKPDDEAALWQALSGGEIDAVGTDHCSFTMAQKAHGEADFSLTPNGGAGVEFRPALIYTYGVLTGRLTLPDMARCLSYNAARLFGMKGYGEIAKGSAADITVWDGAYTGRISAAQSAHNCDNTPFEGLAVHGRASDVILGGAHVVQDGALIRPGTGKYIKREGYTRLR